MNALTDPSKRPAGYVPVVCTYCERFIAWCNPPAPPVPVHCCECRTEPEQPSLTYGAGRPA